MTCPKCNSENVKIETASNVNSYGGKIPAKWNLLYWCCFGWVVDMMLYFCIIGFFGFTLRKLMVKKAAATTTKIETYAVCQDCGNTFQIKQ